MYNLCEAIRIAAILITPFMPSTPAKIAAQIGIDEKYMTWDSAGQWGIMPRNITVAKGDTLFPRIDPVKELAQLEAIVPTKEPADDKKSDEAKADIAKGNEKASVPEGIASLITIDVFAKVELKAAKVISCEPVTVSYTHLDVYKRQGVCIVDKGFIQVCVINLQGLVYLDKIKSPFDCLDDILNKYSHCRIKLVDFHAEATAEKKALGYYADGRVTALVGTHTHTPTSDAQILPQNTAYITDLGMTGPIESVLGVKKEQSIAWLKGTVEHQHFETADGPCEMDCVIIEADNKTGKAISIKQYIVK